jgi:hypothetical protein
VVTNVLSLQTILEQAVVPALAILPPKMDSPEARVMMFACGLQESRFLFRRQLGDGPARGFWQFEKGTRQSRGGVWGVYLHPASADLLKTLCNARSIRCEPGLIWEQLERDDVLAAGVARLLLWTHAKPLPALDDTGGSWAYYLSLWRPGKPHPETWDTQHEKARAVVLGAA